MSKRGRGIRGWRDNGGEGEGEGGREGGGGVRRKELRPVR